MKRRFIDNSQPVRIGGKPKSAQPGDNSRPVPLMDSPSRRLLLGRLALLAAGVGLLDVLPRVGRAGFAQAGGGRVIDVDARRFKFTPNEIAVAAGESVTLALKAQDFTHGFSIPDLGIRADLIPGQTVRVVLPPAKAGRYAFLCDNFCGDNHEEMGGMLIVS